MKRIMFAVLVTGVCLMTSSVLWAAEYVTFLNIEILAGQFF